MDRQMERDWQHGTSRYPDPAIEIIEPAFEKLVLGSAAWASEGSDNVHVMTTEGQQIGKIHLPEPVSNLCFGGTKRNRLFITAGQSVYALYVEAQGVPFP